MAPVAIGRRSPLRSGRRFSGRPSTRAGRRALWLVACGIGLVLLVPALGTVIRVSVVAPLGAVGLAAILAGGGCSIVAVWRRRERSIFVLATLPIWLFLVWFLIGELVVPH